MLNYYSRVALIGSLRISITLTRSLRIRIAWTRNARMAERHESRVIANGNMKVVKLFLEGTGRCLYGSGCVY